MPARDVTKTHRGAPGPSDMRDCVAGFFVVLGAACLVVAAAVPRLFRSPPARWCFSGTAPNDMRESFMERSSVLSSAPLLMGPSVVRRMVATMQWSQYVPCLCYAVQRCVSSREMMKSD